MLGRLLIYHMESVQFTAKFEYLDDIRDFVGKVARKGGFSEKDIYNIQLATDEAASNIIEHAYDLIPRLQSLSQRPQQSLAVVRRAIHQDRASGDAEIANGGVCECPPQADERNRDQ